jgi:acyl-CoA synthetase (AMP-forming)/AMP-acid ligase II
LKWQRLTQTWHYVEKWAESKPEAEALVFQDERLTWADFKNRMDLIAKAFLELGVEKGDRVAMLSMARNDFLTTFMAAGKVGAMWLGLSPKFTLDELRYIIGDCKPVVLVTLREYLGNDLSEILLTLKKEFSFIRKVLVIGEPFDGTERFEEFIKRHRADIASLEKRATEVHDHDDALLMYTSGSTGKPKGVVHTHASIVSNIKIEIEKFYFAENMRALVHFPINHVAADVEIGFAGIMAGGLLVSMDRFDPTETLKIIEKEKLTVLGQVPVMFLLEFKDPQFAQTDLTSVRHFLWAGAAAPKIMMQVLSQICAKTGAILVTGYGSTEVCGFVTYTANGDNLDCLSRTVGKIAEPFELRIVDKNRDELPDGQVGEIAVRGPFLMKGYYNKPDITAQVIDELGWYYTSDLGWKDARGYVSLTGRTSEMYKSGGENVYPRAIEEVIESHPSVLFTSVIGVPDELYQEVGWAFIMLQPGKTVTEHELRELCKSRLTNFKVPKKFFIRQVLPLLATGKVNRIALKAEIENMSK